MRQGDRFGAVLDHVGQAVMRGGVRVEQSVEGGVEIVFRAVFQQLQNQRAQLLFQKGIFQPAAGFGQADGQPPQFDGIGGNAFAGRNACSFHND